jgi:hypothetical protein
VHTAAHHTQDQSLVEGMHVTVCTVTRVSVTAIYSLTALFTLFTLCYALRNTMHCLILQFVMHTMTLAYSVVLIAASFALCWPHYYCDVTTRRRESGYTSAGSNASNGSRISNAASVTAGSATSRCKLHIHLLLVYVFGVFGVHLPHFMPLYDAEDQGVHFMISCVVCMLVYQRN